MKRTSTILFGLTIIFLLFISPTQAFSQPESMEQKIQPILTQLQSDDDEQENIAERSISALGKDAAPPVIKVLITTKDQRVLDSAFEALIILREAAVPALIESLRVQTSQAIGDAVILRRLANALASIAELAKDNIPSLRDAVPYLMKIIEAGQDKHRAAMEIFKKQKDLTEKDIYDINEGLQDYDAAAHCLGRIGRAAGGAVPLLIEVLRTNTGAYMSRSGCFSTMSLCRTSPHRNWRRPLRITNRVS